mgnify:CR=1 FL=1
MKNTISLVRISTSIQTEEMGGTGVEFQTKKLSQYDPNQDHHRYSIHMRYGGIWNVKH